MPLQFHIYSLPPPTLSVYFVKKKRSNCTWVLPSSLLHSIQSSHLAPHHYSLDPIELSSSSRSVGLRSAPQHKIKVDVMVSSIVAHGFPSVETESTSGCPPSAPPPRSSCQSVEPGSHSSNPSPDTFASLGLTSHQPASVASCHGCSSQT